jgi:hypothetical protein
LPDDIASLKAMVIAQNQLIEALKLTIAKLRHEKPSRPTSSPPNASTPTIQRFPCLPRTRPGREGFGPMSATTGPSSDKRPRPAFFYSPDRGGEHPATHLAGWAGVMQADAYAG